MYNRRCYAQQDSVERVSGWLLILYGTNELRARTLTESVGQRSVHICMFLVPGDTPNSNTNKRKNGMKRSKLPELW